MTAPAPIHGGFAKSDLHRILDQACSMTGLDARNAILLRGHTNAVFQLSREPVVVKIARRGSRLADVQRTVRFVQWLMDRGFPTVPLYEAAEQPLDVGGHAVTFWTYLPQPAQPVSAAQLAGPLRVLHDLPAPPFPLKPLDTVAAIRSSLSAAGWLPPRSLNFLSQQVDRLEKELAEVTFAMPQAILQGDPQHRNALHGEGGRAVLCDWDTVTCGQPEWDLTTVEIHCRRFGYGAEHYEAFTEVYGFDVTVWPGYPILRDLRELRMITTNAKKAPLAPATMPELVHRIDGLRQADQSLRWQIL